MPAIAYGNLREKRLVILGCGYVGGELAGQALAEGMMVTALTRNAAAAARLRTMGADVVIDDLASDGWHGMIEPAEYVVNTVSSGGGGVDGYRHSYLGGAQSIARWVRARGPVGTLVYTSSTSVYPQGGGAVVDEAATHDGVGERGGVLREAEQTLRELSAGEPRGCDRVFILRLAGIYGPARHHLLEDVRRGTVAGRPEHRLNLTHRDDVVAAIWAALLAPGTVRDEIFNVADDRPAPKAEVVAWLAQRLGVAAPVFEIAAAGERRATTPDRVIANGKLKRLLDWAPRFPDFRAGYENILSRGPE